MRVLLVDDEPSIGITLRDALEAAGHQVRWCENVGAAQAALLAFAPECVLSDVRMPGGSGLDVLRRSIELDSERPVVIMTAFGTIDQAVEAMRQGAYTYLTKPFHNQSLVALVAKLAQWCAVRAERGTLARANQALRDDLRARTALDELVGSSPAMSAVRERIRQVAPLDATVLIEGESGTGKEVVARALHASSRREAGPFVPLSCAALPESLLEDELFGHERGAFTDARRERKGRFEQADGGTLFLDDIDDMPLSVQVKLLRVLQERTIERVGSDQSRRVDIRVLAATKRPLLEWVREGRFREDLYYRLHVVPIHLPPLRQRAGDVPLLLQHFLARHASAGKPSVSRATLAALERYPWPGNVRELENAVQRALALAGPSGELATADLIPQDPRWRGAHEVDAPIRPLREVMRAAEAEHIRRTLEATGGHRTQSAELLGISRKVLWEKIRDLGLDSGAAPPA
jgi:two-component system response regulator AtoC